MAAETSTTSVKPETEVRVAGDEPNPPKEETPNKSQAKMLSKKVGLAGIIGITIYIIAVSLSLIYMLVVFWPVTAAAGTEPATSDLVRLFGLRLELTLEMRLFLIVAVAGALGGEVHALRSLSWYVGNRNLIWSWVLYYILVPLVSAALAIVFYLVIRGGFFSPTASIAETSPFGFAALAALVGMFSQSAAEKLKEVADTLLKKPPAGKDTVAENES